MQRRAFLAGLAGVGTGLWLGGCARPLTAARGTAVAQPAQIASLGANQQLRVAIVGINHKGMQHLRFAAREPHVRVAAVCDVDPAVLTTRLGEFETEFGYRPDSASDLRRLLERTDIDAFVISTPNHLHALQALWCVQAGKPVYLEKPVTHHLAETPALMQAARSGGVLMQAGLHNHSDRAPIEAFAWLREGHLGPIRQARALCYKERVPIGRRSSPLAIPAGLDYDLWCGPVEMEPLYRAQFHYDWHWMWNTGNGEIGNQAVHELDMCRWVLGAKGWPRRVIVLGNRFVWDDAGETPNTMLAVFDYAEGPVIYEQQGLWSARDSRVMGHLSSVRIGVKVECAHGYYGGNPGGWAHDEQGTRVRQFTMAGAERHLPNFLDAVRAGDARMIKGGMLDAAISSDLPHLANLAYRLGGEASPADCAAALAPWDGALEALDRFNVHLHAWGIDPAHTRWHLGQLGAYDATRLIAPGVDMARAMPIITPPRRAAYALPAM